MGQRPLARALQQIQDIDLCLKGCASHEFSVGLEAFPQVQWINPYQVEKLLGKFPLRVRWFDSRAEEVSDPQGIGWYTALVEGVSPDGITIRRSERFYCSAEGKGTVVQRITGTEEGWYPRHTRRAGAGS